MHTLDLVIKYHNGHKYIYICVCVCVCVCACMCEACKGKSCEAGEGIMLIILHQNKPQHLINMIKGLKVTREIMPTIRNNTHTPTHTYTHTHTHTHTHTLTHTHTHNPFSSVQSTHTHT